MLALRSRLAPALIIALAACGSEVDEALGPPVSLNQGNGVDLHVEGAGVVDFTAAGAGLGDFQFVAHRKTDGSVDGHFRQRRFRPDGVVDFSGVVTCVTIDPAFPGRARIAGVVTENNSTSPAFLTENHEVGDDVWFRVTDAELGLDPADASTTYGFKPTLVNTSEEYCALPFTGLPAWNPGSIFPLKQGTIRVKP
ncbi:MAG TPA: hypothetical protein VGA78_08440 [Gemmatimonadales bacterium]